MQKSYIILFVLLLICIGCGWHYRNEDNAQDINMIDRYDLIEARFLTTGDVAALQQMNTDYPQQTRLLIEDLLQLGHVNDSEINIKLYQYFQDTVLQKIVDDVALQYEDLSDVDLSLANAFEHMQQLLPDIKVPKVYTQIGSLDQSIIVGNDMLGISLDKYLGNDYPMYIRYGYSEMQRASMNRFFIVPDCLGFYLLSLYPFHANSDSLQEVRDRHMGVIQYIVNKSTGHDIFQNKFVDCVDKELQENPHLTIDQLLRRND